MTRSGSPIRFTFLAGLAAAATLCACASPGGSTQSARSAPLAPSPQEATLSREEAARLLARQVEERARASAPGEHHFRLRPLAGEWTVVLEGFGPDGESLGVQAEGRARIEWILGGRFLRWDSELEIVGRSSGTRGFLGYDKLSEEYQLLMISDLVTGMPLAHGRGDLEREGISLRLAIAEDARIALTNRGVLRLVDPNMFTIEQLRLGTDGRERRDQRATYRRVDAPRP